MDDQEVFRLNCELAQRINREALADPSSPFAGKFVGIVNGQVVVVADDVQTAWFRLDELEPNKRRTCLFEASRDYSRVEHV
jgi:hypothetical protein